MFYTFFRISDGTDTEKEESIIELSTMAFMSRLRQQDFQNPIMRKWTFDAASIHTDRREACRRWAELPCACFRICPRGSDPRTRF